MFPDTTIYVSSYYYMCPHTNTSVLIRLYTCPHTTTYVTCPHTTICVLAPRCMCPHTTICVLILPNVCPHTTIHELTSLRVGGLRRSMEALAKRRQRTPVSSNRRAPGRPPLKEHVLQVCAGLVRSIEVQCVA